MPNIIHYRNRCIGCGICYELQPELWRMSKKDGKATLLRAVKKKDVYVLELTRHHVQKSKETAEACPVRIIKVN
ncbi:MAG: ferredoxin [Bacteroidetes bacterium]|nr:ferredoxin [Bacteroidota bacterium]